MNTINNDGCWFSLLLLGLASCVVGGCSELDLGYLLGPEKTRAQIEKEEQACVLATDPHSANGILQCEHLRRQKCKASC